MIYSEDYRSSLTALVASAQPLVEAHEGALTERIEDALDDRHP
jgi:hypothetical protein